MKRFVLSAIVVASASLNFAASSSFAAGLDDLQGQAAQAYGQREYDAAGIQKAQQAADLYGQLVAQTSDAKAKAKFQIRQSEALYFVGNASADNSVKLAKHDQGYKLADQAVKTLGVSDVANTSDAQVAKLKALPADELTLLADGLYERGVNLGKWGSANGIPSSLGKWPELRSNMELIGRLGMDQVHDYGSYRTLGRAYYELPSLLGGSVKKADRYFTIAISKTQAAGETYSINGYTNLYFAEVLQNEGKNDDAKKLLTAFLKADPKTLNPSQEPEVRKAQAEAKVLLPNL